MVNSQVFHAANETFIARCARQIFPRCPTDVELLKGAGLEEDQVVGAFVLHLALSLTGGTFDGQNQALVHAHGGLVPFAIIDWTRVNDLEDLPRLHLGEKSTSQQLQGGVVFRSSTAEQEHVWQSAPESELHVEPVDVVSGFCSCPVSGKGHLHVNEALGAEGEGGGGVAEVSSPAGRAHAAVALLAAVSQQGDAAGAVLAAVLAAAHQPHRAVPPPPGLLARLRFRAATCVKVGSINARGPILAGITVTLINIHLTVGACGRGYSGLDQSPKGQSTSICWGLVPVHPWLHVYTHTHMHKNQGTKSGKDWRSEDTIITSNQTIVNVLQAPPAPPPAPPRRCRGLAGAVSFH